MNTRTSYNCDVWFSFRTSTVGSYRPDWRYFCHLHCTGAYSNTAKMNIIVKQNMPILIEFCAIKSTYHFGKPKLFFFLAKVMVHYFAVHLSTIHIMVKHFYIVHVQSKISTRLVVNAYKRTHFKQYVFVVWFTIQHCTFRLHYCFFILGWNSRCGMDGRLAVCHSVSCSDSHSCKGR